MSTAYATEADLCRAFTATATAQGWDVWPEISGWDLVLVHRGEAADPSVCRPAIPCGFQVAVEAKLRNLEALAAAASRCAYYDGQDHVPHAAAVLVPRASAAFIAVAHRLDLAVYTAELARIHAPAPRWDAKGLSLPEVKCATPGGLPSPKVLSRWRIGALRLCLRLEAAGCVSRADFKREGVEPQRWLDMTWLVRDGVGADGRARYVAGPRLSVDGPGVGYEAECEAIRVKDAGLLPTEGGR